MLVKDCEGITRTSTKEEMESKILTYDEYGTPLRQIEYFVPSYGIWTLRTSKSVEDNPRDVSLPRECFDNKGIQ